MKAEAKDDFVKKLRNKKTIINGRELGQHVSSIPQLYQTVINKAVELSSHVQ